MTCSLQNSLQILILLLQFAFCVSIFGQTPKYTDLIKKTHFSDAEKTVIPGGKPDDRTRMVFFGDAKEWFRTNDLTIADFESVEIVEIRGTINEELSSFISQFSNLKHVSFVELVDGVDIETVISPFSNSKTLRSLEICMVDVAYRDCTFLGAFAQLTELRCDVTFSGKELIALQKLENLRCLEIGSVTEDAQVNPVTLPNIRELTLSGPDSISCFKDTMELDTLKIWSKCSEKDILNVGKFGTLKSVELRVDSVEHLKHLATLKNLESLIIAVEEKSGRNESN